MRKFGKKREISHKINVKQNQKRKEIKQISQRKEKEEKEKKKGKTYMKECINHFIQNL
jgi:hypothetical protein